jgi:EAL domain-containing protein (putative c-di-GMP-specific phosphodiesterase class I)
MPEQFVPVAEASGLIVSIGTWVLERSCETVGGASRKSGRPLYVSVNISGRQLDDSELDATVERVLIDTSLDPGLLTLEVTESALPTNVQAAIERLEPLRRLGVRIAIDDFGTGYSSLGYLKQLRPDVIKIDRSFIAGFLADPGDSAIIAAVVNLGKAVGIEVIAEGVETEAQAIALLGVGCDFGQGYLFGRPAPADAASFAAVIATMRLPAREPTPVRTVSALAR